MSYGRPDYFTPPGAGGVDLGGSNGYTSGTITFFPQDVSPFAAVLIYLKPTGVATGWDVVVDFYNDQLGTKLVEEFLIHTQQGAVICEVLPVVSQWMKVTVTANASGGGQSANIWLKGFTGTPPARLSPGDGSLFNINAIVLANSGGTGWVNVVRSGPAWLSFWTDATNWSLVIDGNGSNTGPWFDFLRAQQGSFANAFALQLNFNRYVPRVVWTNNDGVARTMRVSIVST